MIANSAQLRMRVSHFSISFLAILLAGCWGESSNSDHEQAAVELKAEKQNTRFASVYDALTLGGTCNTPDTLFCDSLVQMPSNSKFATFQMKQDYPENFIALSDTSSVNHWEWLDYDPTNPSEAEAYMWAVLNYFYEGHIKPDPDQSFNPHDNAVRSWYHAPWQVVGINGREPIHGLTRERVSEPLELHENQVRPWNNYAVGYVNAPGGKMFGDVWKSRGQPIASKARAPVGTVATKLLFTTAPTQVVEYLKGSPEWHAYIYSDLNDRSPSVDDPRSVEKVRLVQIDFAVRDERVAPPIGTGWVFGTFIYGGGTVPETGEGWRNVSPVGIAWGNDPGFDPRKDEKVSEAWINDPIRVRNLGYQGRLNGPVDNPISSCVSCHATAQALGSAADLDNSLGPWGGVDPTPWFKNYGPGERFNPAFESLDYSLQLAYGIAGFRTAEKVKELESLLRDRSNGKKYGVTTTDPDAPSIESIESEIEALLKEWDSPSRAGGH